jgi:hypothetical protein
LPMQNVLELRNVWSGLRGKLSSLLEVKSAVRLQGDSQAAGRDLLI